MIFKATKRLTRGKRRSQVRLSRLLIQLFLDAKEDREEALKPFQYAVSPSTPMTFELVARVVSTDSWANSLCCPNCHVRLNLHQPDEEQPSQLLGTCDCCSGWFFLVESELDWEGMLLFELPGADTIRATLAAPLSAH
jgi:hypothetical protein